ncbi:MAG: hypothetical protein KME64_41315 [Scytonematopsis contorta HA4267-MV1]|jgi:hypothetical protein|nr:hypothetical protein [Scytonematopsis contorta HA4267-MV1]
MNFGYPYWQESEKPIIKEYPFNRLCEKYFHLNEDFFVDNADPLFDITIINQSSESVLLTHIGIEVISLSHLFYCYGAPESIELKIQSEYSINIPDIITQLGGRKYRVQNYPEPSDVVDLSEVIFMKIQSPIFLESKAPFRYTLRLKNYQEHMPNNTILKIWTKTSKNIESRSPELHIFTA